MLGRLAYAAAFCVVLPALLTVWGTQLEPHMHVEHLHAPVWGSLAAIAGGAVMLAAWWSLWRRGGGLPMNAFPTRNLVTSGVYALLGQPIYVAAVMIAGGVSVALGSAAGQWIVTPTLALGAAALLFGYELDSTQTRLGRRGEPPFIGLPPDTEEDTTLLRRAGALVFVMIPWLVAYEMLGHFPAAVELSTYLPGEAQAPAWAWMEPLYFSVYLMVPLAVLCTRRSSALREFVACGWIAIVSLSVLYLMLPLVSVPRAVTGDGVLLSLLEWERSHGFAGRAAFPSFHVFWIILAARTLMRAVPALRAAAWLWAASAVAACWMTGMHSMLDLAAGALSFATISRWRACVRIATNFTERIANSWHEWRFGPVRVINHGLYAGAGAAVGVGIAAAMGGDRLLPALVFTAVLSLLGAGIFGQVVVGSPQLLRPFGYYGSLLGGSIAVMIASACGWAGWELAAGVAAAAPWIQCIGRLRCLVQGCCHGRPCGCGIRYVHARSRVCRISKLGGVPVHPTPLYSILGNIGIGILLARLAWIHVPASAIVGGYLIGAGALRFVEEHYRGDSAIRMVWGLRMYQWCAAASAGAGIAVSCVTSSGAVHAGWPSGRAILWAVCVGGIYTFAMGIDFPESNRRFSRLA